MAVHPSAEWCTAHGGSKAPHLAGNCRWREKPDMVLLAMRAGAKREVRELSDADLAAYLVRMRRLVLMAEPDKPEWLVDLDCISLGAAEAEGKWRREAERKGGPPVNLAGWRERKERVRERASLLDYVVRDPGMRTGKDQREVVRGEDWWFCCPVHEEDSPSFVVHADRGTFKCFGCGVGGDIFDWLEMRHGLSFSEALRHLDPPAEPSPPAPAHRVSLEG